MCHLCAIEGLSRDACTLITALIARCRCAVHFTAVVALHQVAAEYEQVQSAAVPAEHEALLERLLPVAPPRPGAAAASAANNAG